MTTHMPKRVTLRLARQFAEIKVLIEPDNEFALDLWDRMVRATANSAVPMVWADEFEAVCRGGMPQ